MASFFDKFRLKTAVDSRSRMSYDSQHVTTADFFQLCPVYVRHLVPGSSVDLDAMMFSRMEPLVVPTFGRASVNLRAFFVPYSYIWRGWNDFITGSMHVFSNGSVTPEVLPRVPFITNNDIVKFLFLDYGDDSIWHRNLDSNASVYDYQISVIGSDNSVSSGRYNLTARGRLAVKILHSLGYKFFPNYREDGTDGGHYNALPLLALCRIYVDWYKMSGYGELLQEVADVEGYLNEDYSSTFNLGHSALTTIFRLISYVNYESDYFTSAWDHPTGINGTGLGSGVADYVIKDVTLTNLNDAQKSAVSSVPRFGNTPFVSRGDAIGTSPNKVTQYILDSLKRLTQYMKRNQLAGTSAADRFKARFGDDLPAAEQRRSRYLGSKSFDLQIGDVFSTSDTDGSPLGDFAGRGYSSGTGTWKCDTGADYGVLIVCSTIIPHVGYYQGLDRHVLAINRFDFWTPEFDGLGPQAISKAELYIPTKSPDDSLDSSDTADSLTMINGVFGFSPRYAHYKVALDTLSGDFLFNSINAGKNSWHLFREVNPSHPDYVVHSPSFVHGSIGIGDNSIDPRGLAETQFDRIFASVNDTDHFNMFYRFVCKVSSPMKPLYDVFEFESERGKDVTVQTNGTSVN